MESMGLPPIRVPFASSRAQPVDSPPMAMTRTSLPFTVISCAASGAWVQALANVKIARQSRAARILHLLYPVGVIVRLVRYREPRHRTPTSGGRDSSYQQAPGGATLTR